MKSEFIPYEQAVEIKELGFDKSCFAYYAGAFFGDLMIKETPHCVISAPSFSQAFRWFREKYNLVHEISWSKYKGGVFFDYDIFSLVLPTDDELGNEDDIYIEKPMETYDSLAGKSFRDRESDTFEEAELACLNKLIEIIKNK